MSISKDIALQLISKKCNIDIESIKTQNKNRADDYIFSFENTAGFHRVINISHECMEDMYPQYLDRQLNNHIGRLMYEGKVDPLLITTMGSR